MLTPSAIAALAELGFYFDSEECPLRYILADIARCVAYADDDYEPTLAVINEATRIAREGWRPVVA